LYGGLLRGSHEREVIGTIGRCSGTVLAEYAATVHDENAGLAPHHFSVLRAEAVRQLGMMGARDELWQLYQKETDVEVKEQMIRALFMGGDSARLIEVANNDANTELRRRAIQHLGMMGRERTTDTILNIYNRQTDPELKEAAIEALFIQQNAETLVALARKETNRDLKARIVQKLSLMRSPAARDYLMELLK